MKFCRFCGTKLPINSSPKFCPRCGKNIATKSRSQSRPPIRQIKPNLIHQPQPLERKKSGYRPQVDNQHRNRLKKISKKKIVNVSKSELELKSPPIQSSEQAQIVYNQKLRSILTRLSETSDSLATRDSYQIADHHTIMLQIGELNELSRKPLFDTSDMEHLVKQELLDSSEIVLRISEFLTAHLSSYDLDLIRKKWYQIKERQAHSELDIERIKLLKVDADKLEKNFNILAYKLESSTKNPVPRSVIFASYPQVYHYYFTEIKKITANYLKKIDESGFYRYYNNEKRLLLRIKSYFESPEIDKFSPFELYSTIIKYLDTKNNVTKKINAKKKNIEKSLIEGYQQFKVIREEYIQTMEKILDDTPIDILLMRDDEDIITKERLPKPEKFSILSDLDRNNNLDIEELTELTDLNEMNKLNDFKKLNPVKDLGKLSNLSE